MNKTLRPIPFKRGVILFYTSRSYTVTANFQTTALFNREIYFQCYIKTDFLGFHGAMGRRIDPSWGGPIEQFLVPASGP